MTSYLLHAAITLVVAIDPIALAPLFIALTAGFDSPSKRRIALVAVLVAGGVLIAASIGGKWLLETLGISMSAFRIAGGLLLFVIAADMLFDRRTRRDAAAVTKADTPDTTSVAVFPLAIPLIAGPASLSAVILLAGSAPNNGGVVALDAIVAVIIVACWAVCFLSEQIDRVLGHTGQIVVTRLLGLLLAALSVQFVIDGVTAVINGTA